MSANSLKVVIPMAGLGTRLRPHTWSKPKQLLYVAGKTVLDHVLESLNTLPAFESIELINIIGYLGEQIEAHISSTYPILKSHYVVQAEPQGQSHAIKLAQEHLRGPMLMLFADTLIETDFSFLEGETADGVAWVKPVPDPRRFGVAQVDSQGWVTRLVEKPEDKENNLVVVGCYYFKDAQTLLSAIDEQMERDIRLKGEFFLADAINIMIDRGLRMRTHQVDIWLDAGTQDALLETNRYLLDHGRDNSSAIPKKLGVEVVPPVFIHPEAKIENAVVGPYVSVASGCTIEGSVIRDSILDTQAQVKDTVLRDSLLGRRAQVSGTPGSVNIGDDGRVSC